MSNGIDYLRGRLSRLKTSIDREAKSAVVSLAAEKTRVAIRAGKSPYGSVWPGKAEGLQNISVTTQGSNVVVSHRWAELHNKGIVIRAKAKANGRKRARLRFRAEYGWRAPKKVKIPKRKLAPDQGLPRSWKNLCGDAISGIVRKIMFS